MNILCQDICAMNFCVKQSNDRIPIVPLIMCIGFHAFNFCICLAIQYLMLVHVFCTYTYICTCACFISPCSTVCVFVFLHHSSHSRCLHQQHQVHQRHWGENIQQNTGKYCASVDYKITSGIKSRMCTHVFLHWQRVYEHFFVIFAWQARF